MLLDKSMAKEIVLFETMGEIRTRALTAKGEKTIICGICGNYTPEKNYLENDCPHCLSGIDYEVGSEGSDKRFRKSELEKRIY